MSLEKVPQERYYKNTGVIVPSLDGHVYFVTSFIVQGAQHPSFLSLYF